MSNKNARWAKAAHHEVDNATIPPTYLCKLESAQELGGNGLLVATKYCLSFSLLDDATEAATRGLHIPWKSILVINKKGPKVFEVVTKEKALTFCCIVDIQQRMKEIEDLWLKALNDDDGKANLQTLEELDQLLMEFRALDTSNKGYLALVQLSGALIPVFPVDSALPHLIAAAFDSKGDGTVQLGEFLHGMRALKAGTLEEKLEYCFRVFDEDRDGVISMHDFEYLVEQLAPICNFQIPPDEAGLPTFCTRLFRHFNPEDGPVRPAEFQKGLLGIINEVPGAAHLLRVEPPPPAAVLATRRGVPLSLGDPHWNLITQILVGLSKAGELRRKTEAAGRPESEGNVFGNLVMHVMQPVGNVLASAAQSTGLDHIGEAIHDNVQSMLQPFQANVFTPLKRDIMTPFQGLQTKSWRNTFTFPGAEDPETHRRQEVRFTEFNGRAFWDIRAQYGFDEDAYQRTLGLEALLTGLVFGNLNCPRRLSSSGKSASFFFITHDSQIIMKTLPRKEAQTLCQMLMKYRDYMLANGDTLLTVYLGLYEIAVGEQKVMFVTMLNVFPPSIQVQFQYDLKGSTQGRSVPEQNRVHNVALKDLDFHQQKTFLVIAADAQQRLFAQIERDAEYLQSEGLNDYSLLLGIAEGCQSLAEEGLPGAETCRATRCFYRGIPDADMTETYYFGIIDILTAFEGAKVVEHAVKSVYQKNFSCIPPVSYAQRFVAFMEGILCSRTVEKVYIVAAEDFATFGRIVTVHGHAPPTVSTADPRLASPLRVPASPTTAGPLHYSGHGPEADEEKASPRERRQPETSRDVGAGGSAWAAALDAEEDDPSEANPPAPHPDPTAPTPTSAAAVRLAAAGALPHGARAEYQRPAITVAEGAGEGGPRA